MVAPFPRTMSEIQNRIEVEQLLNECWKNPDAGYEFQPTDEWIVNNQHEVGKPFDILINDTLDEAYAIEGQRRPSTYGEITTLGARQLFGAMGMMDFPRENPPIHFFDLGSGTGKLVGQVVLELPSHSVKATGIELSPSRHESAVRSRDALMELAASSGVPSFDHDDNDYYYNRNDQMHLPFSQNYDDKFELLQGDLFDADLSTATHIYVASLCFPHDLMVRLEDRLQEQREDRGGSNTSVLQWVATLQPFPNNFGGIRPVVRFMEMSWTKPLGCAVYLYRCND